MFGIAPLAGTFGAEISGVDLAEPLSEEVVAALSDAIGSYKVLVFHDQHGVGPAEQVAFARRFGRSLDVHPFHPSVPGHPEVTVLEFVGDRLGSGRTWHTDGATRKVTSYLSVLRAVDIPAHGRDTVFADMEAAYDHLSTPLRAFLDGLTALHSWGDRLPDVPPVEHPLVMVNPRTGRRALYANFVYTRRIPQLRPDESDALLELLFRQAQIPDFQLRVRWAPGTIAFWDNQSTQHYLTQDLVYPRVMHRVMVTDVVEEPSPPPAG